MIGGRDEAYHERDDPSEDILSNSFSATEAVGSVSKSSYYRSRDQNVMQTPLKLGALHRKRVACKVGGLTV